LARALAVALLAAGLLGCGKKVAARPNVIVVLVDTLRADHLSLYGYGRKTSPVLDRFARRGIFFPVVRSQAACTFPSVNSLLTSRYPMRFVDQPGGSMGIPAGVEVLPEVLQRAGYETAAISASPIVRVSPSKHNPSGGFGRGFGSFDESCVWRHAACVNQKAFEFLRSARAARPFFLYLHYMDPHGPYSPPKTFERRFSTPVEEPEWLRRGDSNFLASEIYEHHKTPAEIDPAAVRHLVDLYDDEIRYFDGQLGQLLAEIDGRGLGDTTVVAIAADHGEQFLEHGGVKHCRSAFDVEVRTPLALRVPGRPPQVVEQPAGNVDLAPTLLALLGVDARGLGFEGRDLLAPAGGAPEAPVFSGQGVYRAATGRRFKLLYDIERVDFALYDLEADPAETRDVKAEHPEEFRELRRGLFAWLLAVEGSTTPRQSIDAARAAEQQLKSLGYLE